MIPQWIIEKKRDGNALTDEEIRFFIEGFTRGSIPDYQMAAMAMAIYIRGMTPAETAVLTDAMMRSGDTVDTSAIHKPKVDKHSTGGIGDKVSLVLAPLVACCGIAVPMISGRGLGITGGTLDKLEAIPGYRTTLSDAEFLDVIQKCGCSITGQTGQLAPADKKLYALRDVTGTVASIPLITASIMAKKLAEGADALVLDVKWGAGAFMRTPQAARELAQSMVDVGLHMNKGMAALITDMNQPLGQTAGNALEILETIETLKGQGPADLVDITLQLGAQMLLMGGKASEGAQAMTMLKAALDSGEAYKVFVRMVELHGGDTGVIEHPERLVKASILEPFPAPVKGYVAKASAEAIGKACLVLGAGRAKTDDKVDLAVGASHIAKVGQPIEQGEPLLMFHANDRSKLEDAKKLLAEAFSISAEPVKAPPLITDRIIPGGKSA